MTSAHYEKHPYCFSCKTILSQSEIVPHESMSHLVLKGYAFGGYKKPPITQEESLNKTEKKPRFDYAEEYGDEE